MPLATGRYLVGWSVHPRPRHWLRQPLHNSSGLITKRVVLSRDAGDALELEGLMRIGDAALAFGTALLAGLELPRRLRWPRPGRWPCC